MLLVVLVISSKSLENVVLQIVLMVERISCASIINSSQMMFTSGKDCPRLRLSERSLFANCVAENGWPSALRIPNNFEIRVPFSSECGLVSWFEI